MRRMEDSIRFIKPKCESYERFVKLIVSTSSRTVPCGYREKYVPFLGAVGDQ